MMTAIIKKHLKKNKKGFTLVEVVVVLVILAILAAIAVPALTGYISDSKERTATTEARTLLVGMQHMASTQEEDGKAYYTAAAADGTCGFGTDGTTKLNQLTGVSSTKIANISGITVSDDTIKEFVYQNGDYTVTYNAAADNKFSVE